VTAPEPLVTWKGLPRSPSLDTRSLEDVCQHPGCARDNEDSWGCWAREGEFVDVSVDLADGSGCVNLTLHRSWLTSVKPPLPPEPPVGTVVLAADGVYQRHAAATEYDEPFDSWFTPGSKVMYRWSELCRLRPPVRLIPEPTQGEVYLDAQRCEIAHTNGGHWLPTGYRYVREPEPRALEQWLLTATELDCSTGEVTAQLLAWLRGER
jgi:hypothetical protein